MKLVRPESVAPKILSDDRTQEVTPSTLVKRALVWKGHYETRVRPAGNLRLVEKRRLTPHTSERGIYHFAFTFLGSWKEYEPGASLAVYVANDEKIVDNLLERLRIDPYEIVIERVKDTNRAAAIRTWLIHDIDLHGKPSKKFYYALGEFARSQYQKLKLLHTGSDDNLSYKVLCAEGTSFLDLLRSYDSLVLTAADLVSLLPKNKPRLYSISSSHLATPSEVHLLVAVVKWLTPKRRLRVGQCSTFLASLEEGAVIRSELRPAMMSLSADTQKPIVMAGLGTGIAPFRAFVLDRDVRLSQGNEIGPIVLYFGARHRESEYLYGEDFDRLTETGLISRLGLAFSRDQEQKVYIQHKMVEDSKLLRSLLKDRQGTFYLCGPTWPVPDVKKAINQALESEQAVDSLKEDDRYKLEVY